mmetsp:Transcript_14249/g.23591  ORF Transcript_14249/g.23591 Transcript_14249/m.23591 type:complete len:149 (+) Transcript_14249:88-534(+)|eukprot:CAMPEP_0119013454 /NCGR_PEP_ID=MMETSP1176-20130426/8460_1 /TAXON_ID=265551 /ORGANISM="Synedropsis recta cf, Strain CCMP1620" /LENGTH=148 /DNA_ID=CAMNT_0006966545 /DNA_START=88 /DNA_END=534 /DNA_ORIENTATION=+
MSSSVLQSRRSLYVGGLADDVGEVTLRAAMIPFGPIKSIEMPRDYKKANSNNKSAQHKGFGFVEFDDADDAAEALDNMDGADLMGRTLNVSLAQASGSSSNPAHNKAVWSTDEWFQQQQAGVESAAEKEQREKEQGDEVQLKEQVAMP